MSRSLKKGPYIEPKLLKKIETMNTKGEKKVIRTWSRAAPSSRRWWDTLSPFMMATAMCRFTSPKTWSAIAWANLPPPAISAATWLRSHLRRESKPWQPIFELS